MWLEDEAEDTANLEDLKRLGMTRPKVSIKPMTDPNGAAIYGVPWIPSTKTPFMLALM